MNYRIDQPTWPDLVANAVNVVIGFLCILLFPSLLFGGYGQAPLAGLVIQLFWICILPILLMPLTASMARRFRAGGREVPATLVRFAPLASFVFIGPALAWLTKFIGVWIMAP